MAIANETPRIEVEILIDGVVAQEYMDEEEGIDAETTTRYVESKSGANFAIHYRFTEKPQHDVLVDALMDGKCLKSGYALLGDFRNGTLDHDLDGVRSNQGGQWTLSKFSFSNLNTVDSAGQPMDERLMKDLKSMGQISINFHYVNNLRLSANQNLKPIPKKTIIKDVPEKALKGRALSHQSTLSAPIPARASTTWSFDYLDATRRPFASIDFKYRSRNALKFLLIIPRSPNPQPLEERDVDTLSPEEMRTLLRRQRERNEAPTNVKREGGAIKRERSRDRSDNIHEINDDDDDVSFVSAKRRRQLPVTVNEDGTEIIDLT